MNGETQSRHVYMMTIDVQQLSLCGEQMDNTLAVPKIVS